MEQIRARQQGEDALWADVEQIRAQQQGEDLYKALCAGNLVEAKELLTAGADVGFRDVGGMTALHRAARLANAELVGMLLERNADANLATFPGRAPGLATPLAVLAEADMTKIADQSAAATTRRLLDSMSWAGIATVTTNVQSIFHLAASRGNEAFLEHVLGHCRKRDAEGLKAILNRPNHRGRSVADVAQYNAKCKWWVMQAGGVRVEARGPGGQWVPATHHGHRSQYRGSR